MDHKEIALAADFLKGYADRLGNDCCNDWDFPSDWTHDEIVQFVRDYHEFNGDPEEFDENHLFLPDFAVAEFLAHRLLK